MAVAGITETTQYLTFKLEDEVFAVDINKIREVLDYTNITKVPKMPDFSIIILDIDKVFVEDLAAIVQNSEIEQRTN